MPVNHEMRGRLSRANIAALLWFLVCCPYFARATDLGTVSSLKDAAAYRGPVDLVVLPGDRWCVTANELSNSVSLVDLKLGQVVDEVSCGKRPNSLAVIDSKAFLASCRESGSVERYEVVDGRLRRTHSIQVGLEPMGLAADPARNRAYVGLVASGEVAELNLETNTLVRKFPSGNWPRTLAISPDGTRLAVGLSGDSAIAVHRTDTGELLYDEPLSGGINIGHLQCSADGTQVYFPWMIYRTNPITQSNIQRGWVLASRVARVRLDGPSYREAISLDVPRRAVADPFGLAISADEKRMVVSSSGTHELLVYRLGDLPFVGIGGPGDLIDRRLLQDDDLFFRIEVGGRPMAVRVTEDNTTFCVANHTLDCVQLVDISKRKVIGSIPLGLEPNDAEKKFVHRGMQIYFDAGRSLDQWYSCNSCHLDGGVNAKAMDTWNDGTELSTKTVLPLFGVTKTGPWTWHGWQEDLSESIQNSFTSTMMGKEGSEEDVSALMAYLETLQPAPNALIAASGEIGDSAKRGRVLFEDASVGCADCHSGNYFTDGQIHDVGLGSETDKYDGFNTPSLIGLYRKVRFLHDGRAKSLEKVLTQYHRPQDIGGGASLTDEQLSDLIEYLKTL